MSSVSSVSSVNSVNSKNSVISVNSEKRGATSISDLRFKVMFCVVIVIFFVILKNQCKC